MVEASTSDRTVAVVQVDTQSLTAEEQMQVIGLFRSSIAQRGSFSPMPDNVIQAALVKKNPLRDEVESFKKDQAKKQEIIRGQLDQAIRYYLASEFEESVTLLQSAFQSSNDALYRVDRELPKEILKYLSATHFFLGNEDQAKAFAAAILDLDPDYVLDAQKFPPPYVELFSSVKAETRFRKSILELPSNQTEGVKAEFMGHPVSIVEGANLSIEVLANHPLWGTKGLVLEKNGFAPIVFDIHQPPEKLEFVSLEDRKVPTRGLFAPIGTATPPVELKTLMRSLNPHVLLLASVNRNSNYGFDLQGQWLENQSLRVSPIVSASHSELSRGVEQVVSELFDYVSSLGFVMPEKFVTYDEPQEIVAETPYYKTWWFWSLVGVAVVGAGVGGYFLLKPGDNLQVRVGAAP